MGSVRSPSLDHLNPVQKAELRERLELRQQYAAAAEEERARIQRRAMLEADFPSFVKAAWPVIRPGISLSWSWHYDLIGEYLTLVKRGDLRRLIINISPRTLKSILVSVMFPAWVWASDPIKSFAGSSYSGALSTEHSVMRRTIIQSDWYRGLWGDKVWLAADQNEKTKFKNNFEAQMIATSVGGTATGLGGNILITDDAMSPRIVASEAHRVDTHTWFDGTWRGRLNDRATDALIVVEQRTGEMDLTGHLLTQDKILEEAGEKAEWTHLCIPLEADDESLDPYTRKQTFVFPISNRVVERSLGEVLQPDRFPPQEIASMKAQRMTYTTQYQQRPSALEGNLIKRSEVQYFGGTDPITQEMDAPLPEKFDLIVTSADCTFKDTPGTDFVAIGTFGIKHPRRYVLEVVNKRLDLPATENEIVRQKAKWNSTIVLIEDKANGSAIIKSLKKKISGVVAVEPEGGKLSRFSAMSGEWQGAYWFLDRNAGWAESYIDQLLKFPGGAHDDQCDMTSQAAIYVQNRFKSYGLLESFRKLESEHREDMAKRIAKQKQMEQTKPLQAEVLGPGGTVRLESSDIAKIDTPGNLTKPLEGDNVMRCDSCGATAFSRVPGGGYRCQQCGNQQGSVGVLPTTLNRNTFQK